LLHTMARRALYKWSNACRCTPISMPPCCSTDRNTCRNKSPQQHGPAPKVQELRSCHNEAASLQHKLTGNFESPKISNSHFQSSAGAVLYPAVDKLYELSYLLHKL
jgi:hypothetical protein